MKHDGKVTISTLLDNSGLQKGIGNISGVLGGLKSVLGKMSSLVAAAFSVTTIVQFGVESSKAARELSDALTGLQSIVEGQGRSFSNAKAFLDEYVKDGLIPMTNAVTAYKNLAARGYDDSQIQQTLIALKDASAFGRQASYSMGEAVQSATEGLKNENSVLVDNAGVTKNVAKMWDDYARSIGTTAANLTQQQKIQAEVSGILEESRFQTGDAAKVAGTLSGKLQQLSYNFNNLKVAVGNAVNPVVEIFLPAINTAVVAVTRFANSIAALITAITGKSVSISTGAAAIADSYSAAAGSAKDLEKATTAAGKAAKKSLAGFDEINKLNDTSGSGSAGSGGSDVTVGAASATAESLQTVSNELSAFAENLKDKILDGDWYGAGKDIAQAISKGIEDFDWTKVGETIEKAVDGLFTLAFGVVLNIDPITTTEAVWEYCTGLFNGIRKSITGLDWFEIGGDIAAFLVKALVAGIFYLDPRYMILSLIFNPKGKKLTSSVAGFVGAILGALFKAFLGAAVKLGEIGKWLWETLKKHVDEYVNWEGTPDEIISGLFNGIIAALSEVKTWVKENIWEPLVDGFCEAAGIDGETCQGMKAIGNMIIDGGLCSGMLEKIKNVKQACGEVWSAIKEKFAPVKTWFKETFSDAWKAVKDVFSPGEGTIFDGIKEGIAETFRTIVNRLISGINSIITKPFNSINYMLNNIRERRILGQQPFLNMWGYNPISVPQIPYLAQGAVLPPNKPFMAVVGDQKHGTNIEAPLATIQEAVAVVMENYSAANMAGHEATVAVLRELLEAVLGISIGDDVIANAVTRYNQKMAVVRGG